MGMYDTFTYEGLDYQTKDLNCELDHYWLKGSQLMISECGAHPRPPARPCDFHGFVHLRYPNDDLNGEPVKLKFNSGKLEAAEPMNSEAKVLSPLPPDDPIEEVPTVDASTITVTRHEWGRMQAAFGQLEKDKADLLARVMIVNDEARKAEAKLRGDLADKTAECEMVERLHAETVARVKLIISDPPYENEDAQAFHDHATAVSNACRELRAYLDSLTPKRDVAEALGVKEGE